MIKRANCVWMGEPPKGEGTGVYVFDQEELEEYEAEIRRNAILDVLEKYNTFLVKNGYTDTDIIYELDINEFLISYENIL